MQALSSNSPIVDPGDLLNPKPNNCQTSISCSAFNEQTLMFRTYVKLKSKFDNLEKPEPEFSESQLFEFQCSLAQVVQTAESKP